MPEAYIVDAVRSPVGRRNGGLAGIHPADLGAHSIRALMEQRRRRPGRGRRRDLRLRRHDRSAGGRHRAHVLARRRAPRGSSGHDRGSPVRLVATGGPFRRAGGDVGHQRPRRRGRRAEHDRRSRSARRCSSASSTASSDPSSGSPGWEARVRHQEVSQFRAAEMIAEKWDISREEMEAFAVESHRRALARPRRRSLRPRDRAARRRHPRRRPARDPTSRRSARSARSSKAVASPRRCRHRSPTPRPRC